MGGYRRRTIGRIWGYWFVLGGIGWSTIATPAVAQLPPAQIPPVIPDQTLPTPSTVVGSDRLWQVEGGTQAGDNLFHSFEAFSIPIDHTVRFVPGGDIAQIIARVTGAEGSLIDGVLASEGTATLFLVNPNGIVLGPNAQLQLGGSFIGTTADSVVFADGMEFRAGSHGTAPPLLTATMPLGLQFGQGIGTISGTGQGPTAQPGLGVTPGQTLGLVGRSLNFSGVALAVPSGRLELGAVTEGTVGLQPGGLPGSWRLEYGTVDEFGPLTLQRGSSVVGLGVLPQESGAVVLAGDDITVSRSRVLSQTSAAAPGPSLEIQSTGTLAVLAGAGDPPLATGIFSVVPEGVSQDGGAIAVTADQLNIQAGGRLQSSTQGPGNAGDLLVSARAIAIDGFASVGVLEELSFDNSAESAITSLALGGGDSGAITVAADQVALTNGAVIETLSAPEARGRARSVDLTVADQLTLMGVNPENAVQTSRIATLTFGDGIGEALTVRAGTIQLADGAQVITLTSGRGSGGALDVMVDGLLQISGENLARPGQGAGSAVATIAFGAEKGGDITINANHIRLEAGASLGAQALNNFLGVTTIPEAGQSDSGQVVVRADLIELIGTSVFNSAVPSNIASATFGSGDAGPVLVEANELRIFNGGTLASSTLISFLGTLEQPEAGHR